MTDLVDLRLVAKCPFGLSNREAEIAPPHFDVELELALVRPKLLPCGSSRRLGAWSSSSSELL